MTDIGMQYLQSDILLAVSHPSEAEALTVAMRKAGVDCEIMVTGVGGAAMSWALQKRLAAGLKPRLVINAGIAGAYKPFLRPGDIVVSESDCFADMGIDDNGSFVTLFQSSLADADAPPFRNGRIYSDFVAADPFSGRYRLVSAATVNMTSGSPAVIERIMASWNPDIESMEGAWLAYICSMAEIDWLAVKSISNMVEPRDRSKWNIPLALHNLESAMPEILNVIMNK